MNKSCGPYDNCYKQLDDRMKKGEGMPQGSPYINAIAGAECYSKNPNVNFIEAFGTRKVNRVIRWIIIIIILYILATLIFKLFKPKEVLHLNMSTEAPRLRGDTIKRWFVL